MSVWKNMDILTERSVALQWINDVADFVFPEAFPNPTRPDSFLAFTKISKILNRRERT